MGHTIQRLAQRELKEKAVFDTRLVVEVAEKMHIHYRNLRLLLSVTDWEQFAKGIVDAYSRWQRRGMPQPAQGVHIELCRKEVAHDAVNEGIKVNLNDNLYINNEGKIFAEGADFLDKTYIHLKIRDMRLEMSLDEFNELADAITEAKAKLGELAHVA
jgi:hypothetical protein